ncbi:MAG: endonuclease/exonuclease/phosphatase family protein [Bacteroidota bacterium]
MPTAGITRCWHVMMGENYTTQPTPSGNSITLNVNEGSSQAVLVIAPEIDNNSEADSFTLTLASSSSELIGIGDNRTASISITEESNGGTGGGTNTGNGTCNGTTYATGTTQCNPGLSDENLDIVTWNIEFFPTNGNTTIGKVIDIITDLDADVYAVQEINNISSFNTVINSLNGYEGEVVNIGGSLDLGFIYKTSEIVSVNSSGELNLGISPRDPVVIDITHSNGLTAKLLNIHLKCCGDSDDVSRRVDASEKLKEYIDTNLSEEEVIVLGDWNEDFVNGYNSFSNFISDSDNYIFADRPINDGSTSDFSYPSWPSHLDHILITNELCDNLLSSYTITLDDCVSSYFSQVSDHRPVMVSLKPDEQ